MVEVQVGLEILLIRMNESLVEVEVGEEQAETAEEHELVAELEAEEATESQEEQVAMTTTGIEEATATAAVEEVKTEDDEFDEDVGAAVSRPSWVEEAPAGAEEPTETEQLELMVLANSRVLRCD